MTGEQLWQATVPGIIANRVTIDTASGSAFVGDGWQVAHAALSVRRLALEGGRELARVRTRSRPAEALVMHGRHLAISTDRRVLVCDAASLEIVRTYDYAGVRWARRMALTDDLVVVANAKRPSVTVIDRASGAHVRRSVGAEPLPVAIGGEVRVLSAVVGGERRVLRVDAPPTRGKDTPGLVNARVDATVWAQRAGASDLRTGATQGGEACVRLDGDSSDVSVGARQLVAVADATQTLWVKGADELVEVARDNGAVLRTINLHGADLFAVCPASGLAITGRAEDSGLTTELTAIRL